MSNDKPPAADTSRSVAVSLSADPALPTRVPGRGLALCALVVALLAAGGVGYWITRVYVPTQTKLDDALASSDRAYTGLGGELHALHEQLQTAEAAQVARDSRFTALTDDVAKLTTQLASSVAPTLNLLRRARVEHLVKTADFSLRVTRDRRAAEAALLAAESELDPSIPAEAALQQALRADQAVLAAVSEPEVDVLNAQWAEYARQLATLAWRDEEGAAAPPVATVAPTADWRGIAAAIWRDLLNLVEIRTLTEADKTHLDPAREALINAGIQTEVTTLRSALQSRNTAAAHTSAAVLLDSLRAYHKADDPALAPLRAALLQLAEIDLAPPLPSLAASLRGLETLQRAAYSAAPAPAPPSVSPAPDEPSGGPREIM